ncbi:unnamed protein product [Dovyalis caffra]|uniref:RING-type E3 ubiquitin transferase n=1 Tax=Dovyalis caffra TaxID=77055 RepID=A0AAV1SNF5_9ROSI|nr:unnamed protein product [Dovyalis caffra]
MASGIEYGYCVNLKPQENHQESQHINGQPLNQAASMLRVIFSLYKFQIFGNLTDGSMVRTRPVEINSEETCIPITSSLVDDHEQEFKEILTVMGIPVSKQSDILKEMASVARSKDTFSGVFMGVELLEGTFQEITEADIARAEMESMDIQAGPVPAAKSCIDALERVDFDGSASARDCTVCMEEIDAGREAIRMPCSHVYHSDCIVRWLQTSRLCPLCRYRMPCEYLRS